MIKKRKSGFIFFPLGFFILGLMSKTAIAPFPPAMLAVLWWKRGSSNWKREILPILPFFLAAIGFGIVTFYVERRFLGAWGKEFDFTFIERCLVAGRAFWFYLGKLFGPRTWSLFIRAGKWTRRCGGTISFHCGGAALWAVRGWSRAPLAIFIYFIAMLFPVLGFMNACASLFICRGREDRRGPCQL